MRLFLTLVFLAQPLLVFAQQTPAQITPDQNTPPPTSLDSPELREARERIARGDSLLEREDFDGALSEFRRALELIGTHPARPLILFNIARAHERLLRYDLALDFYDRYLLEAGPDAEDRQVVEATLRALRGFLGTLVIESNIEAEVWVDERLVGTAPGEMSVPGGRHAVELRAEGHESQRRELQLAPSTRETLRFELDALAEEYRGVSPRLFRIFTATAAVALVGGVAMGARALRLRSRYRDQIDDPVDGLRINRSHESEIHRFAVLADVFLATAAATGVTALVLAFFTDWREDRVHVGVSARRSGGRVSFGAFF